MDMKSAVSQGSQLALRTVHRVDPISGKSILERKDKKKKAKIHCPMQMLKNYQIQELEKSFRILDSNNDGKVSVRDIKTMIRACGFNPSSDEMRNICLKYDPQNEGLFSLGDYVDIFILKLNQRDKKDETVRAFKFFDRNQKGFISLEDLKHSAFEIGEFLHDEEIQEMLDEADINADGCVSQKEFLKLVRT